MRCWICGACADSREHKIKKRDLVRDVGKGRRFYYHDRRKNNSLVQGLNSNQVKFDKIICHSCNTNLTHPYDSSWDRMSEYLYYNIHNYIRKKYMRCNAIFPYDTKYNMLNVYLFFAKLFGCNVKQHDIPIDLNVLAYAVKNRNSVSNLYLRFGMFCPWDHRVSAQITDMEAAHDKNSGSLVAATWFYCLRSASRDCALAVNVTWVAQLSDHVRLHGAWHPRLGAQRMKLTSFHDQRGGRGAEEPSRNPRENLEE